MQSFSLRLTVVMVTPYLILIFTKTLKILKVFQYFVQNFEQNIEKIEYEVYQIFISFDTEKENPRARFSK